MRRGRHDCDVEDTLFLRDFVSRFPRSTYLAASPTPPRNRGLVRTALSALPTPAPRPPTWHRQEGAVRVALLLAATLALSPAQAQVPPGTAPTETSAASLVRERWTVRDGLPVNHANTLYQTPDGYLWLATFYGLVRFDGVRFVVFNAANTPGLPSNRIARIYPDTGAAFWLTTEQGHLVRVEGGRFTPLGVFPGGIRRVVSDGGGLAWVATTEGLYRYGAGRLAPFAADVLGDAWIEDVLVEPSGALWVSASEGAIWRFGEDGARAYPRTDHGLDGRVVLYRDADGAIWAGGEGVARFAGGRWETFAPAGAGWARPGRTAADDVTGFYREPGGPLWLVTRRGLYRLDGGTADGERRLSWLDAPSLEAFRTAFTTCPDGTTWMVAEDALFREGHRVAAVGSPVYDLHCDGEGSVWAATQTDGLHHFRPAVLQPVGPPEGLGLRNVYGVYEDRRGGLWFTGQDGVITRLYDGRSRHLTAGTSLVSRLHGGLNAVANQAVYEDRAGDVWIGFQVCRAADRAPDGECERFAWAPGAPRHEGVYAILQTRDGALWFGAVGEQSPGLYRLHSGGWTHYATADGLADPDVRFLLETRGGELWAATLRGGVARFDPGGAGGRGRFAALTTADGLASDHVRALHESADGVLWIATEDRGLVRRDPASGALTTIRQSDGLYDDGLHTVVEDGHGRLWMSTNRGLFWVARADLDAFARGEVARVHSTSYTERDGMRNREANGGRQGSALRAADGRLWFATQDGAVVVDPAALGVAVRLPPPLVEGVIADGEAVPRSAATRSGAGTVELAAERRSFRITYTAPTFAAPERVLFRYWLDGYDAGWVEAEGRREAAYTRVPPGRYTFRVAASNGDGTWVEGATPLALRVAPFAYETAWFRVLGLLAVAGLAAATYRARTRRLRRRGEELEAEVAERTEALRAEKRTTEEQARRLEETDRLKSRFFTNVSHEFRTPLTLTIGPLEDLQADGATLPAEARRTVELALRNSRRMLRLINQLLDVAKLEVGAMRLEPRLQDLAPFVRGIARSFTPLAERRRVRLTVEAPEDPVLVPFDADKLEQVVVNLVSNAIKFTPEGGAIHVTITREGRAGAGNAAVVTVRDSGPGIAPETLPHLFERFYQAEETYSEVQPGTGVGLSLAKDLTELHGGTISVESAVGFGATFTVRLPLGDGSLSGDGAPDALRPNVTRPALPQLVPQTGEGTPEEPPADAETPDADDRTTVLIADDNAEIRAYVRRHLEPRYRVLEAADGALALATARECLPDLIVSDVMMPALDGFALVRALRADPQTDFLPVLLLTARAADEDKIEGLERGADDYLTKPFNVRELRARVENLIASRQRLREHFAAAPPAPVAPPSTPAGLSTSDAAFLALVRTAVEAHLGDEDFGVERLAAAVEQSRSTLHRRLRHLLQESPTAFIRRVRLEHAAALLSERRGTISEVAYAVGFRSVSHFCHVFRIAYGLTPASYTGGVREHDTGAG